MKELFKQAAEDLGVLPFILMVFTAVTCGASFFLLMILLGSL